MGIVTSIGTSYIFVNFDIPYGENGQACKIEDLKFKK